MNVVARDLNDTLENSKLTSETFFFALCRDVFFFLLCVLTSHGCCKGSAEGCRDEETTSLSKLTNREEKKSWINYTQFNFDVVIGFVSLWVIYDSIIFHRREKRYVGRTTSSFLEKKVDRKGGKKSKFIIHFILLLCVHSCVACLNVNSPPQTTINDYLIASFSCHFNLNSHQPAILSLCVIQSISSYCWLFFRSLNCHRAIDIYDILVMLCYLLDVQIVIDTWHTYKKLRRVRRQLNQCCFTAEKITPLR